MIAVEFRDTWTGATEHLEADVVVLAADCIETPRLWLSSGLPDEGWIGRGLTTRWFDFVAGVFDPGNLEDVNGQSPSATSTATRTRYPGGSADEWLPP